MVRSWHVLYLGIDHQLGSASMTHQSEVFGFWRSSFISPRQGIGICCELVKWQKEGNSPQSWDIAWLDHRNVRSRASPIQCLHLVTCLHLGRSPKVVGRLRWRGKYSTEIAAIVWNPLNPWKEPRDWMGLVFLVRMRMNWFGSWRFLRSC